MKKLIIWIAAVCLIVCCVGCESRKTDNKSYTSVINNEALNSEPDDKVKGEQTDSENDVPAINDEAVSSAQDDKTESGMLVETEYFTLTVPKTWKEDCFYEVNADGDSGYTLTFYDKDSRSEGSGGMIFSVQLLTEYDDYTYYPDYDVLGSVEVSGIDSYNLIAVYPTDVQFSEETAKTYGEMFNSVPDILDTLTAKDGCVFSETPLEIEAAL